MPSCECALEGGHVCTQRGHLSISHCTQSHLGNVAYSLLGVVLKVIMKVYFLFEFKLFKLFASYIIYNRFK